MISLQLLAPKFRTCTLLLGNQGGWKTVNVGSLATKKLYICKELINTEEYL